MTETGPVRLADRRDMTRPLLCLCRPGFLHGAADVADRAVPDCQLRLLFSAPGPFGLQVFLFSLSHKIFGHIYGVLNIDKKITNYTV